ncbi:ddb1 and cul4 associated factor 7 [Dinochytrium kinnereticum]|nr:ddb1 and cul4 associated factor 7 [Dinochytrium kinnereticum]
MSPDKQKYNYIAPWTVYAMNWSQRPGTFRLGFGSFIEEYNSNKIQVIQLLDKDGDFQRVAETDHNYPVSKLMWSPYKGGNTPDLFATTSDFFRLYEVVDSDERGDGLNQQEIQCKATLTNVRRVGSNKRDFCAPLTSFDWNETDPSLCVTSSIDTTCTVWDVNTQQAKTQLIAHDKEVYDVAFARGTDVFASVGADGSVRMFDLRALDHSTIIFETPSMVVPAPLPVSSSQGGGGEPNMTVENPPLVRLSWNKQDPNYLAAVQVGSSGVLVLDIRVPAVPVVELFGHEAPVNSISWAPHSSAHICTAGDDRQALIWDISQMAKHRSMHEPILAYSAAEEINQLTWSSANSEWVAISFANTIQALKEFLLAPVSLKIIFEAFKYDALPWTNDEHLVNPNCLCSVLLSHIKKTCGFQDLAENIDLASETGEVVDLVSKPREYAKRFLEPRANYIVVKVVGVLNPTQRQRSKAKAGARDPPRFLGSDESKEFQSKDQSSNRKGGNLGTKLAAKNQGGSGAPSMDELHKEGGATEKKRGKSEKGTAVSNASGASAAKNTSDKTPQAGSNAKSKKTAK